MKKYISIEISIVKLGSMDVIRTSSPSGSDDANETEILPFMDQTRSFNRR